MSEAWVLSFCLFSLLDWHSSHSCKRARDKALKNIKQAKGYVDWEHATHKYDYNISIVNIMSCHCFIYNPGNSGLPSQQ